MEPYPQPTRVLAVRHGETDWNVEHRIQGRLDVPLNATGRRQAQRVARALADDGIDAIVSSDQARARETAEAIAAAVGLPLAIDEGLRERGFGEFEGLTYDEITQRWPLEAERWRRRDATFGAPGGETLQAFSARCIGACARLAEAHAGRTLVLVSHGGVMDCLYRAAARVALDAPRTWALGNASINRLLYTPQGFTLVGWSDTHHLDAADGRDPGDDEAADVDAAPGPARRSA